MEQLSTSIYGQPRAISHQNSEAHQIARGLLFASEFKRDTTESLQLFLAQVTAETVAIMFEATEKGGEP